MGWKTLMVALVVLRPPRTLAQICDRSIHKSGARTLTRKVRQYTETLSRVSWRTPADHQIPGAVVAIAGIHTDHAHTRPYPQGKEVLRVFELERVRELLGLAVPNVGCCHQVPVRGLHGNSSPGLFFPDSDDP